MTKTLLLILFSVCAQLPSVAQDRDFLSADEIDQLRNTQEPNARMKLYLKFAHERVALIEKLAAKDKPGRSGLIHDTLEDYGNIVEAIDTVADDALKRGLPINEGVAAVAASEKKLLESLEKIQGMPLSDLPRYQFALTQAIETTQDSIDLSSEDVGKRGAEVAAQERKDKQERDANLSETERAENAKTQATDESKKRKAPTLLKPGEKLPNQ